MNSQVRAATYAVAMVVASVAVMVLTLERSAPPRADTTSLLDTAEAGDQHQQLRLSTPGELVLRDTGANLLHLAVSTSPRLPEDTALTVTVRHDDRGARLQVKPLPRHVRSTLKDLRNGPLEVVPDMPVACDDHAGTLRLLVAVDAHPALWDAADVVLVGPDCDRVPPQPPLSMYAQSPHGLDEVATLATREVERRIDRFLANLAREERDRRPVVSEGPPSVRLPERTPPADRPALRPPPPPPPTPEPDPPVDLIETPEMPEDAEPDEPEPDDDSVAEDDGEAIDQDVPETSAETPPD